MIDFINTWGAERSGLRALQLVDWLGVGRDELLAWLRQEYLFI